MRYDDLYVSIKFKLRSKEKYDNRTMDVLKPTL